MSAKILSIVNVLMAAFVEPFVFGQTATDGFDPNVDGTVRTIAVQADGKILVGGYFSSVGGSSRTNIARLNPDGSVDDTFHSSVTWRGCPNCAFVYSIVVQPDAKILVAGAFTEFGGEPRTNIARFNPDGSVDAQFNPSNPSSPDTDDEIHVLALQPDGKILVGGDITTLGGQPRQNLGRLNADGSLDSAFSPGADERVEALVVQADGRILVGGTFSELDGETRRHIGRLLPDGSLDESFDPGAFAGCGTCGAVECLAIQPDGRILVGGMFDTLVGQPRSNLGRLDADGRLDTLFDPHITWDGQHGSDHVTSLAVQADGSIVAGGWFGLVNGQPRLHLARLNPDGILDPSLNPQPNSKVWGLAVQSDGGILVGGSFTTLAGQPRNHLGRLYPDGSLDATLDPSAEGGVFTLATQADGHILVGGGLSSLGGQPRQQLGRLKSDGSLDASFNPTMSGDPALPMAVFSVAVQEDGRILMGGTFTNLCGQPRGYLGRLNPDGSLDSGFDPGASDYVLIQALQPDGKILIGGAFTNLAGQACNRLARLEADGRLDTSFTPGADGSVATLTVQADGKIVVGGGFTMLGGQPRANIGRLNPDGTLDPAFDPGADSLVRCVAMQPDGKILVGGDFATLAGERRSCIARLHRDGRLDASFGAYADNAVFSLTVQADGRILLGGFFSKLSGQPRIGVGRLNPDGSADVSFLADAGSVVCGVAVQDDGKVLVGGWFRTLAGRLRSGIGRLSCGTPAIQSLTINSTGQAVTWNRSGSGPEVEQVTFEISRDGTNYTLLGRGTRIPGGWRLADLPLPVLNNFSIRARGRTTGGMYNASSGLIESLRQFYLPPRITRIAKLDDGHFTVTGRGAAGQECVLLTAPSLAPPLVWTPMSTNTANTSGVVIFPDLEATDSPQRFYQLQWP